MMGDLREGVLDFHSRLDAQDQTGKIVHSLPFERAVNIIREGSNAPLLRPI